MGLPLTNGADCNQTDEEPKEALPCHYLLPKTTQASQFSIVKKQAETWYNHQYSDITNKDTEKFKIYKIIKNSGLETLYLNPEQRITVSQRPILFPYRDLI